MLKVKLWHFGHLMLRADSLEKTMILGKIEGGRIRGQQRMRFGWHHWLDGHEFEQALWDGEGQGSLVHCSSRGHKESDLTEWLNWTDSKAWNRKSMFLFALELLHFPKHWLGLLLPILPSAKQRGKESSQRTHWTRFAEWLCFPSVRCQLQASTFNSFGA